MRGSSSDDVMSDTCIVSQMPLEVTAPLQFQLWDAYELSWHLIQQVNNEANCKKGTILFSLLNRKIQLNPSTSLTWRKITQTRQRRDSWNSPKPSVCVLPQSGSVRVTPQLRVRWLKLAPSCPWPAVSGPGLVSSLSDSCWTQRIHR